MHYYVTKLKLFEVYLRITQEDPLHLISFYTKKKKKKEAK